MATTTFESNVKGWKIGDYVTRHIQFYTSIQEQQELGNHAGMKEYRRVDLLLDDVKNKWLGGLKSNILSQAQLFNDFIVTANHLKDVVNRMPELATAPGRQVAAFGGCGRGRGRGGRGYD